MDYGVPTYNAAELEQAARNFVTFIDKMVEHGDIPPASYQVTTLGSFPLLAAGATSKETTVDIDVFSWTLPEAILTNLSDFLMNTRSLSYGYALPYNYEDRLRCVISGKYCTVMSPSFEDLAFSKLMRADEQDIDDIVCMAKRRLVDWDVLRRLVTDPLEACGAGTPRARYHEMLIAYCRVLERVGRPLLSDKQVMELLDNAL